MINKRGAVMGEWVLTMYHLLLVMFIALGISGVSAIFYEHYIDVRGTEAMILSKQLAECVSPKGIVNLADFNGFEQEILAYCNISNVERFYVNVEVYNSSGEIIGKFSQGDSGAIWIKELYQKIDTQGDQYRPGYFTLNYGVLFNSSGRVSNGRMKLEALVNNEI